MIYLTESADGYKSTKREKKKEAGFSADFSLARRIGNEREPEISWLKRVFSENFSLDIKHLKLLEGWGGFSLQHYHHH